MDIALFLVVQKKANIEESGVGLEVMASVSRGLFVRNVNVVIKFWIYLLT